MADETIGDRLSYLKERKASCEKFFDNAEKHAPKEAWAFKIIGARRKDYERICRWIEVIEYNQSLLNSVREGKMTIDEAIKQRQRF